MGPEALGAWVQAGCVWCGAVEFALQELRVHAAGRDQGLLEFTCPSCRRLNVRALGAPELTALAEVGAEATEGPAPFELLEEHAGPPITWDDLIDFHDAVSRLEPGPWRTTHEQGPERAPARERDAA